MSMNPRRKDVAVSRIHGSREWSRWKLLSLAVLASSVLACKSTGTPGPSEPPKKSLECPAELLQPQPSLTYTLSCDGFTPKAQRLNAGAKVTFVSTCDSEVTVSFSDPDTLFDTRVASVTLKDKDAEPVVETVSDKGGCHEMCWGHTCPPADDVDSKSGSLDVYTSGGQGPEGMKPGGP